MQVMKMAGHYGGRSRGLEQSARILVYFRSDRCASPRGETFKLLGTILLRLRLLVVRTPLAGLLDVHLAAGTRARDQSRWGARAGVWPTFLRAFRLAWRSFAPLLAAAASSISCSRASWSAICSFCNL